MMLLGVFLHVLLISKNLIDARSSLEHHTMLGLYFTGHAFRLPAFFVLAGFFASLLIAKRGPNEFLRNRGRRLGLVLVLIGPFVVLVTLIVRGDSEHLLSVNYLLDKGLLHLWFIYYLLILSVLTYLLTRIQLPESFSTLLARAGVWISNPRILWGAPLALSAAPLFLGPNASVRISGGVIPDLSLLGFYALFFAMGILLYRSGQSGLDALERRSILLTAVGFIAAQLAFGWGANVIVGPLRQFLSIVASFYLALGVIGIFIRFASKVGPAWAYFTRTSYWVYLVHLPFVYAFLRLLAHLALPPFVTIAITFVASVALSLASFELLVRRTPLARLV
jgi:peptidoglycan/LPS O-acetylase OafA/YrhL